MVIIKMLRSKVGVSVRMLLVYSTLSILGVYVVETVQARTWHVPDEVPTIKDAVEDSASWGDTVLVAPGVYDTTAGEAFPISMKDGVVLISETGALTTIIDANTTNSVITCENLDSTTVIAGFTITGGRASKGGGLYCANSFLEIRDNIIKENNATDYGGGIYCYYCSAVIDGNKVVKNIARWGGGVFNDHSSPIIIHNIVDRNRAILSGAGLDCYSGSAPTITDNVVIGNSAGTDGAGIACCYNSSPTITYNTIARNVGSYGGGIRTLGFSSPTIRANIIVDNVDGVYLNPDSYEVTATDNNLYFNTYQIGGYEVINNTSFTLDLTNNFWWITDSSSIDSLIYGPGNFIPFHTSPIDSAPGEPSAITSVTVMTDSTYTNPVTGSLNIGDTLYIQLEGSDWNSLFIEPALVIISSTKYPYGIGVALIETGTSTGVYRGSAYIDITSDDLYNRIGVNSSDTLIIRANVDPSKCDTVIVELTGVEESEGKRSQITDIFYLYQNYPNPFNSVAEIRYQIPFPGHTTLRIYNPLGQLVRTLVDEQKKDGFYRIRWDGCDAKGKKVKSGIYFYHLKAGNFTDTKKLIILK